MAENNSTPLKIIVDYSLPPNTIVVSPSLYNKIAALLKDRNLK